MTDSAAAPEGRWTARSAARRLIAVAREDGPGGLWVKLLGEAGYRRLGIHELRLADLAPAPAIAGLGFRELRDEDPPPPGVGGDERAERIAAGHRCYLTEQEGRVRAACWVAGGSVPLPYLGGAIRLSDGEACTFETWTDPRGRGRGIGPALRLHVAADLRRRGISRLLAMIYPENDSGVRMVQKLGYRRIGSAVVLRSGERSRLGMRMQLGCVAPGRWPG